MIEKRPVRDLLTHGSLILGLLVMSFPIYIALVTSSHLTEDLIATVQGWFGDQMVENYSTILRSGKITAGGVPVGPDR